MANPQKEDGFTAIANSIMEALSRTRIPGERRQIMDHVFRMTFGFNRTYCVISIESFIKSTKMSRFSTYRAIKDALDMKIIEREEIKSCNENVTNCNENDTKYKIQYKYRINKDFEQWKKIDKKNFVSKKIQKICNENVTSCNENVTSCNENVTSCNENAALINTNRNTIYKENFKAMFDELWKIYPNKKAKKDALKAWLALKPSEELFSCIMQALRNHIACTQWNKDDGEFIPLPATWIRGKRWEDVLKADVKSAAQLEKERSERFRAEMLEKRRIEHGDV